MLNVERFHSARSCLNRAEALRHRDAASHAEGARRNFQSRRTLAAFVFGERDFIDHVIHDSGREAAFDDLVFAQVFHDVVLQNRVEDVVFGQRVLILLIGA